MQISLKLIRSINHAKSTVYIKFQLLVTFSSLFTASSSLPVFPLSVLYLVRGVEDKKKASSFRFGTRYENLYTWVVPYSKMIQKGRAFEKSTESCKMPKIYCQICKNWYNSETNRPFPFKNGIWRHLWTLYP